MNKAEFLVDELARLEKRFLKDGDVGALAEAVQLCGWNAWPLPEWCVQPVLAALKLYNDTGSRGRTGTPRLRYAAMKAHRERHDLVAHLRRHGSLLYGKKKLTLDEACEEAAKMLGKRHGVSGRMVKKSYRRICKEGH